MIPIEQRAAALEQELKNLEMKLNDLRNLLNLTGTDIGSEIDKLEARVKKLEDSKPKDSN